MSSLPRTWNVREDHLVYPPGSLKREKMFENSPHEPGCMNILSHSPSAVVESLAAMQASFAPNSTAQTDCMLALYSNSHVHRLQTCSPKNDHEGTPKGILIVPMSVVKQAKTDFLHSEPASCFKVMFAKLPSLSPV